MPPSNLKTLKRVVPFSTGVKSSLKKFRLDSPADWKVRCYHCGKSFPYNLEKHFALDYLCGIQHHQEELERAERLRSQTDDVKNQLFPEADWDFGENDNLPSYNPDQQEDIFVVQSAMDLKPVHVVEIDTTILAEYVQEHHGTDDSPEDIVTQVNANQTNSAPPPNYSPRLMPDPSPPTYDPVGRILFPENRQAGQPVPTSGTPTDGGATLFDDWLERFRSKNQGPMYGPMQSSIDWEICHWAKTKHIGKNDLDALLSLPGVRVISSNILFVTHSLLPSISSL